MMSVCLPFQYLKQLNDFYKIRNEYYFVAVYAGDVGFNFLT
jgi:hypothetical protein